jgi:hypothetical protein
MIDWKIAVRGETPLTGSGKKEGWNRAVLPDGFFSNQKTQFVKTLEGLAMEDVGIFYVHLINFPAIWYIYPPFGTFFPVLVCCTKKNLATLEQGVSKQTPSLFTYFVTIANINHCLRNQAKQI